MSLTRIRALVLALLLASLGASLLGGSEGAAQEASPPRPSHIHAGDCDELDEVIQPLTSLTVPSGAVLGNSDAVVAEAAFSTIPQSLDDLLAADHSLKVHLSAEQIEVYLACGDIGGALDANGALIVGMKELDDSGYAGIAYLVPSADGGTTISVMIAQVIPDGTAAAATPAEEPAQVEEQPAAAAETPEAADTAPEVVDVTLTEFTIDMPTELSAGPIRFSIANSGGAPHNFVVEGPARSWRLANNLQPGQSGFLNVNLAPGTYTVYCPVGEGAHRANGMELTLTVT